MTFVEDFYTEIRVAKNPKMYPLVIVKKYKGVVHWERFTELVPGFN